MLQCKEIEFRAYNKITKEICSVVDISFRKNFVTVMLQDKETYKEWNFNNIVLMQYIGVLDNKGNKIFEGDYLKNNFINNISKRAYVFYDEGIPFYGYKGGKKRPINVSKLHRLGWLSIEGEDGFEIDGNIFNNHNIEEK